MMQDIQQHILDRCIPEPNSGCWIWLNAPQAHGYGTVYVNGKKSSAHKASYQAFVGPVPSGLQLDHKCRLRCCVNPEHLEPVTPKENIRRGLPFRKRKTRCPHGHEFSAENTHIRKSGAMECRACMRDRMARRRAARKG